MNLEIPSLALTALLSAGLTALGFVAKRAWTGEKHREQASLLLNYAQIAASLKTAGAPPELIEAINAALFAQVRKQKLDAKKPEHAFSGIKPLDTQIGMNVRAAGMSEVALAEVQAALTELRLMLSDEESEALDAAQGAWSTFADLQAEFAASQFSGGTMAPLIRSAERETLARQRLASLRRSIEELNETRAI